MFNLIKHSRISKENLCRDNTERKRAEEALRDPEDKFITAFKNIPVSITITSATDGKYIDANDIFLRGTGYTHDEIIGHTSEELRIFTDQNDREQLLSQVRKKGFAYGIEINFRMKSGEIRFGLISTGNHHRNRSSPRQAAENLRFLRKDVIQYSLACPVARRGMRSLPNSEPKVAELPQLGLQAGTRPRRLL